MQRESGMRELGRGGRSKSGSHFLKIGFIGNFGPAFLQPKDLCAVPA